MDQPLVSVLTPVFNAEDYIEEVLIAVSDQTYPHIEHIVIDDGSTDSSPQRIRRFVETAARSVRVVTQPNSGEAAAVNRAFSESQGRYVVVVNADDPPYPDLITCAVQQLEADPGLVVVYPDWEMIDENGVVERVVQTLPYSQQALVADYVCIPGPGAVIRAAAVGGQGLRCPRYRYVSDYDLWLRLSLQGSMRRMPMVLARWRRHAAGATAAGRGRALANEFTTVIDDFFARDDLPERVRRWQRQARAMVAYHAAIQSLHDSSVAGRRLMFTSLSTPFLRRARYQTHRRRALVVIAVLLRPLSLPFVRRAGTTPEVD